MREVGLLDLVDDTLFEIFALAGVTSVISLGMTSKYSFNQNVIEKKIR